MKILVITQKVASDDPILGFFHRWIEKWASRSEKVTVICLGKGTYDLPANVKVLSLGKEEGKSKVAYLLRFYHYIWSERRNYDVVFVHMNQEYVLLAGAIWRFMGKRVFLWRNHAQGGFLTRMAGAWSEKVFHTSPRAYVARFSNAVIMPAGIDLEHFKPASLPVEKDRILVFGRLSPVKRLEVALDGLKELELKGVDYKADFVGDAPMENSDYAYALKEKVRQLGLLRRVRMLPSIPHTEAPKLYRRYKLLINLTPDGSLDKTIFEALASGLKVVVANSFFKEWLPSTWVLENPGNAKELAEKLRSVLPDSHTSNSETQGKISVLLKEHGLENLMDKLQKELS